MTEQKCKKCGCQLIGSENVNLSCECGEEYIFDFRTETYVQAIVEIPVLEL